MNVIHECQKEVANPSNGECKACKLANPSIIEADLIKSYHNQFADPLFHAVARSSSMEGHSSYFDVDYCGSSIIVVVEIDGD